ncbi:MAG: metallophosphoesterase [Nitrososphaerales archaeon]
MLIAHISDTHLGYSQFNLEEREEDIYDAFGQAIDISIREGVSAVILAGDIFHSPRPPGGAIVRFGDQLKKLKEKGIRLFFVLGEHDLSRVRGVPVPYAFHNLGFATYLNNGKLHEFNDTLFVGFDKFRQSESEDLVAGLRKADEQAKRFSGRHRVLVLHQGLLDISKFAGEIASNDLPSNFTYYAMGHFHDRSSHRFEGLGGPLVYPGSIEITASEAIGEAEKGFYIVDLSGKEAGTHWHKLEIRPQVSLSMKYDELAAGVDDLVARIRNLRKKPILHLRITGRDIDARELSGRLSKLADFALHYRWDLIDESRPITVLDERPGDIATMLMELAGKTLGSEGAASFALQELLPRLEAGETEEALEIAWQSYERSRTKTAAG